MPLKIRSLQEREKGEFSGVAAQSFFRRLDIRDGEPGCAGLAFRVEKGTYLALMKSRDVCEGSISAFTCPWPSWRLSAFLSINTRTFRVLKDGRVITVSAPG
ncbi:MAG: hypothetical protein ACOCWR_05645, partial [Oceanidesulfovibrio sp.]